MASVDEHTPAPGAVFSARSLLWAWAGPATVCGVLVVGLFVVSPFAGGIVGIAGVAYLATSLLLTLGVILLRRAGAGRPRPPVVILTATWTSAWVSGILTFGLIALLLGALDPDQRTSPEGFAISPVFWLLSFPMYLVFLVMALVVRPRLRPRPRS